MRLRRTDLQRRINGNLTFRASDDRLSSYAGLELLRISCRQVLLPSLLRRYATKHLPGTDYGKVSMILLVLAVLFTGGRRLRCINSLCGDPVVERFCSLRQLPTARSVTRWMKEFDNDSVIGLRRVNEELVGSLIRAMDLPRLTIDIDGSVLSTGLQTEGAKRGYNPHRRKVPSYYPISAYEANSGLMLGVLNRSGNVHDGKASPAFIQSILDQCQRTTRRKVIREIRMDGAFFRRDVLELLDRERVEYAIKAPMHDWLGLKQRILKRRWWTVAETDVDFFTTKVRIKPWKRTEKITVYRRLVNHKRSKHFQLDLFDPDDGHYEYSAVASNKSLSGKALWKFMNGRGTHEKVYGELKSGFAFAAVPTQSYHANSAWQLLNLTAFNINRAMQATANAEQRPRTHKRRSLLRYEHINTLRQRLIHRAGLLLNVSGKAMLDLGANESVLKNFVTWQSSLQKAA